MKRKTSDTAKTGMNLYILRHALAGERSSRYPEDTKRPITKKGKKETRAAAKGMRKLDLKFDLILSSPFTRAKQTAEVVAEVFKFKELRYSKHLASEANPQSLISELNKSYSSRKNILLVGHEPYLSQLISVLTSGDKKLSLDFKKSGLCKLTVDKLRFGRCADLQWLLTPKQLAMIAGR
ncbi:MAG: phosphohistidine phosphatase SixA [Limisphaerales bacterium]